MMGGAFATAGNWRDAYLVVVGAAVASVLITFLATDSSAPEGRKLDLPGQATFALGLIAVLFAATQGSEVGFCQPRDHRRASSSVPPCSSPSSSSS